MSQITFELERMNATQLAMLYKVLVALARFDDAARVYAAGAANCGAETFCYQVARASDTY